MQKNVLVATDFSPYSFGVIKKALQFAQEHQAVLHIGHVVEKTFFKQDIDIDTVAHESLLHLQEEFGTIKKEQFHCVFDELEAGFTHLVQTVEPTLVILGASGARHSILKNLLGSSTKSIVRAINTPCLIVKSSTNTLSYNRIAVSTDLSEASEDTIKMVASLFNDATIELIHSYSVPFQGRLSFYGMDKGQSNLYQDNMLHGASENLTAFYDSLPFDKTRIRKHLLKDGLDPIIFSEHALQHDYDLLALHTTGNYSLFAFDLLEHSDTDVLITKIHY